MKLAVLFVAAVTTAGCPRNTPMFDDPGSSSGWPFSSGDADVDGASGESDGSPDVNGGLDAGEGDAEALVDVACWTLAPVGDGQLALLEVDMATGGWEEIGRYGDVFSESFHTAGVAYLDGHIITSGHDGNGFTLYDLDLATGSVDIGSEGYLFGLTDSGDQILAFCQDDPGHFCFYDDFESLCSTDPAERLLVNALATRLGASDHHAYCAWHSTDLIEVYDLRDGARSPDLELEGYDDWVWGISVAGGLLFLIKMNIPDGQGSQIVAFDVDTGARRGEVALEFDHRAYTHPASGLYCESPGPELP